MVTRADSSSHDGRPSEASTGGATAQGGRPPEDPAHRIAELEEALREERETAGTLLDLARSLVQARSAEDVARRASEAVPRLLGVARASVFLLDEEEESFRVAGTFGWTPEQHQLF